jgi:hypothetical protein
MQQNHKAGKETGGIKCLCNQRCCLVTAARIPDIQVYCHTTDGRPWRIPKKTLPALDGGMWSVRMYCPCTGTVPSSSRAEISGMVPAGSRGSQEWGRWHDTSQIHDGTGMGGADPVPRDGRRQWDVNTCPDGATTADPARDHRVVLFRTRSNREGGLALGPTSATGSQAHCRLIQGNMASRMASRQYLWLFLYEATML